MASSPQTGTSIEVVNFPKGTILFRQGDKGEAAYLVNTGSVGIFRENEGRRIPLATIRSGELLGEMAVIDGSPRLTTAFTLEDCTITVIGTAALADMMRRADPFIRALLHMLLNSLRNVHDSYTPKARSLLDSIGTLQRHSDHLAKFLQGNLTPELKDALGAKLSEMNDAVSELRNIANAHRVHDRRDNAILSDADLPAG